MGCCGPDRDATGVTERPDGSFKVRAHQVVRDTRGHVLSDTDVGHVYAFRADLVSRMTLEDSSWAQG